LLFPDYRREHAAETNLASGAISEDGKNVLKAQLWRRCRNQAGKINACRRCRPEARFFRAVERFVEQRVSDVSPRHDE
jgi:hypothetical protein